MCPISGKRTTKKRRRPRARCWTWSTTSFILFTETRARLAATDATKAQSNRNWSRRKRQQKETDAFSFGCGSEGIDAGLSAHAIVIAGVPGKADGADDLAVRNDWNSAFYRHRALKTKNAKTGATRCQRVLERLGRALEARRGAGFID